MRVFYFVNSTYLKSEAVEVMQGQAHYQSISPVDSMEMTLFNKVEIELKVNKVVFLGLSKSSNFKSSFQPIVLKVKVIQ